MATRVMCADSAPHHLALIDPFHRKERYGTYIALDTSSAEGMWEGLRGASPRVTAPPSYSEDGKAVYRGKGRTH